MSADITMEKFKKTFAFVFFILAGLVLGGFIAYVCSGKPYVGWLAWGKDLGFEGIAVDLYVIRFDLALMIHATISQIFTVALSLILFAKVGKNI